MFHAHASPRVRWPLKVGKRADPPKVGEHTVAILKDLGLDDEAIALLRRHGKIGG